MKEYNYIRWERLKELNIEFNFLKSIVKNSYSYEMKEKTINEFIKNISWYKNIDECDLLNKLEEYSYKKIDIFSIEKYKKNKEEPFISDITNDFFRTYFKVKSTKGLENNKYCYGELDSTFRVVYYNIQHDFAIFKMARVSLYSVSESQDDGTSDQYDKEIYDCCKFYIDLKNKLIFMHFNDIKNIDTNTSKEITKKKNEFRALFTDVTNKNMLKYFITKNLEVYFKNYMNEIRENNQHKLVSIIEASSYDYKDGDKSLIRSVERNFIHSRKRLDAIESDIGTERNLTITEIECTIDDKIIDLKGDGEIYCINNFFYKEVINNVCQEFFNGYKSP